MPVHDWTRVEAGIFHDFHTAWIPELRRALNGSLRQRAAGADLSGGRWGMPAFWRDVLEGRDPLAG